MTECPMCGCAQFYVKNPEDDFEMYEFAVQEGAIVFPSKEVEDGCPEIRDDTETYCDNCSWHGKWNELKKAGR